MLELFGEAATRLPEEDRGLGTLSISSTSGKRLIDLKVEHSQLLPRPPGLALGRRPGRSKRASWAVPLLIGLVVGAAAASAIALLLPATALPGPATVASAPAPAPAPPPPEPPEPREQPP